MKAATKVDRLPAEGLSIVGGRAEMEERKMNKVAMVERYDDEYYGVTVGGVFYVSNGNVLLWDDELDAIKFVERWNKKRSAK